MSSVVISGDTSGAVTLAVPAVAGTNTITVPASTGTIPLLNGSGNLTIPTSNAGIIFNNSSATTNSTLNDYESGSYTLADTSGAGLTFSNVSSFYVKIGQLVFVSITVNYPVTSNGNTASISLPFTSLNIANGYQALAISYSSGGGSIIGYPLINSNSSSIGFRSASNTDNQLTNANLSNKLLIMSGCYKANF